MKRLSQAGGGRKSLKNVKNMIANKTHRQEGVGGGVDMAGG